MGIKRLESGLWKVHVRIRSGGKIVQCRDRIRGSKQAALAREAEIKATIRAGRSLKADSTTYRTFGDLAMFYRDRKGYGTMMSTYHALERDLGNVRLSELPLRFDEYIQILKTEPCRKTGDIRAVSTVNRYIACAKSIIGFANKGANRAITGITENLLSGYTLEPEQGRDRVLNDYEQQRLLSTLERLDSYLYWPVRFSLKNPIRRGDLTSLTWANLDRTKPWVHFYASKTRKRRPRETCLPFIDGDLLAFWDRLQREHPDNPYLFPRIDDRGVYHSLGSFKKHWHKVLVLAGIEDFRFHDLKHDAITWMLDNGYSERDLKNLGIQYTSTMIDRYYKHDASKVLKKWQCESNVNQLRAVAF
jgi:integrase